MKKYLLSIGQIITNLAFVPIFFIKFFHSVAVLPVYNESGEFITTNKTVYYYSPIDNLNTLDSFFLIYLSIGIIVISITLIIVNLVKPNHKKLKIANYLAFSLSLVFFFTILLISSTVNRKY